MRRAPLACVASFPFLCVVAISVLASLPAGAQQAAPNQSAAKQASSATSQQPQGKAFSSPDEAAAALYSATRENDDAQLLIILGPSAKDIITWTDSATDRQADRLVFAQKYNQMHRLVEEPDGTVALYIGAENWPLPIPLLKFQNQWYFDVEMGKKEILFRRIGENEIEALQVCRTLADAEEEYYDQHRAYAARFLSREGTHDGLYWEDATPGGMSPIGPFLAHAGYTQTHDAADAPFHGYYYQILTSQGPNATGGAKSYLTNGKMTGGFAILAFPAKYRSSGVMTFLMSQDGVAYQKDLGPMTAKLAAQIKDFDPGNTWEKTR